MRFQEKCAPVSINRQRPFNRHCLPRRALAKCSAHTLLFISLSWLCIWFCIYFLAIFIVLRAVVIFVVPPWMSTAADGAWCHPRPSQAVWATRCGLAVCDMETKETEYKGKAGEEIYALAKNTVSKSCHRQHSLVSILPRLFFQTSLLFYIALSIHPCRYSNINVLTLTYLQSRFCVEVE